MRKHLFVFAALLLVAFAASAKTAQKKYGVYAVGFYNQENLFDTCHDEGKNDYEYTPAKGWNDLKYQHKLHNMARVLAEMGTDVLPGVGCAFIGLSEVENDHVMNDLTSQPALAERGFKYVHIEGPDRRGVDCALIYNPQLFTVKSSKLYPYVPSPDILEKNPRFATRGFLTIEGQMAGEDVTAIVCHWPSRFSGSRYRELAAAQVSVLKDSLLQANPKMKIFVMGDLNDDPTNKSISEVLSAKGEVNDVKNGDMYNPWYNILVKEKTGTLTYQGSWNLFDQIILTPNLVNKEGRKDYSTLKFFKNQIFRRDYLFQQDGQYKGSPLRTKAGGRWLDGFSDHLPVVLYLIKEKK